MYDPKIIALMYSRRIDETIKKYETFYSQFYQEDEHKYKQAMVMCKKIINDLVNIENGSEEEIENMFQEMDITDIISNLE